jgi:hypothetical protein
MIAKLKNEPVVVAFMAFVGATIALLIAFNVHVSAVQREAIEGWCFAAVVLGVAVRSLVTPTRKARAALAPQLAELIRSEVHAELVNIEAARKDPAIAPAQVPVVQQPPAQ